MTCCIGSARNSKKQRVLRLVLLPLILVAFVMSVASLASCRFVVVEAGHDVDDDFVEDFVDGLKAGFGQFKFGAVIGEDALEVVEDYYTDNRYDDDYYYWYNDDLADVVEREVGIANLAVGQVCIGYPDVKVMEDLVNELNEEIYNGRSSGSASFASDIVARAFGVLGAMMGAAALLGMVTTYLFVAKFVQTVWWIGRVALCLATFGQAMTFLLFDSVVCTDRDISDFIECKAGPGAILSMVSLLFYLAACAMSFFTLAPYQPMCIFNPKIDASEEEAAFLSSKKEPGLEVTKVEENSDEDRKYVQVVPASASMPSPMPMETSRDLAMMAEAEA